MDYGFYYQRIGQSFALSSGKEQELDFTELSAFFKKEQEARDYLIKPMPHLTEVLAATKQKGVTHFAYTHKGITANDVLERLGVHQYFTEW